ncbi:MAG: tellurite resistance TerB family protein, partial [Bacteroidales bacterium]|nr:tellurite resistance TerB family protein [Bacteroidales bacterium]
MKFTSEEMAAIVKMCNEMVLADGRIDARETDAIEFEFKKLGITTEEAEIIYTEAYKMDAIVACSLIRDMDDEKKKEVTAFIGAISAS